jgi:class 3 adenylate cyclase
MHPVIEIRGRFGSARGVIFEQDAGDVARFDTALAQEVEGYETMVRQAVSSGQLLTAIEVARDGIQRFGKTKILQQQLALALAQTGALDAAKDLLAGLVKESAGDEETLSLLGRVHKELWRRARNSTEAAEAVRESCAFYRQAFALNGHYYPGINLAFTLAASGELAQAEECARNVAKICRKEISHTKGKIDGWLFATLAEALVHQGETTEAAEFYRKAASVFEGRWRDLASMRRQAREVLHFQRDRHQSAPETWADLSAIWRRARAWLRKPEQGEEWLDRCFAFPSVVVFAGHMIDLADRPVPRFPPGAEPAARDAIRQHLLKIKAGFGYSSAASGGDIIFCECLLEMEAKVNLVLPCSVEAFKRQSVSPAGPEWERRFHHVLANCTSCTTANPIGSASGQSASPIELVYANRIATGLASLQAQALDLELQAIALWNGVRNIQVGGTASVVGDWERQGLRLQVIPVGEGSVAPTPAEAPVLATASASAIRQEIKAMLFADVVDFQRIGERQMPAFVEHFKGAFGKLMAEMGDLPTVAESWAGVHYFMYDRVGDAARFALALRDLVVRTRWADHGLPPSLGIRIVLHAGPVFEFVDPTLRRLTCTGSHVNRAARIEALTPRDQVYATQEFAALCGMAKVSDVSFEYLGYQRTTTMFENAALYRVDWLHDEPAVAQK